MTNSELFALRYITADRTQTSLKSHLKKTQSTTTSLPLKTTREIPLFLPTSLKCSKTYVHFQKLWVLQSLRLCRISNSSQGFSAIAHLTHEVKNMKKLLV